MKSFAFVLTCFVSSISIAANEEIAVCNMSPILANHSPLPSDFYSDHGVQILNNSSYPMNYKIVYSHEIMNMLNDKTTLNVVVNPGQKYVDVKRFTSKKVWDTNGQYYTRSMTIISMEGKAVARCGNNNYAYVT
jgi:hypothetical protein